MSQGPKDRPAYSTVSYLHSLILWAPGIIAHTQCTSINTAYYIELRSNKLQPHTVEKGKKGMEKERQCCSLNVVTHEIKILGGQEPLLRQTTQPLMIKNKKYIYIYI